LPPTGPLIANPLNKMNLRPLLGLNYMQCNGILLQCDIGNLVPYRCPSWAFPP